MCTTTTGPKRKEPSKTNILMVGITVPCNGKPVPFHKIVLPDSCCFPHICGTTSTYKSRLLVIQCRAAFILQWFYGEIVHPLPRRCANSLVPHPLSTICSYVWLLLTTSISILISMQLASSLCQVYAIPFREAMSDEIYHLSLDPESR